MRRSRVMKASHKKTGRGIALYAVMILVAVIMFAPIVWIFSGGFKTLTEFTTSAKIIPEKMTLENYIYIFTQSKIGLYVRNTLLLIVGNTVGTLLSSSLVAYALARLEFRGKNVIFSIIVATMMIPNIALIIPQYIISIFALFRKNWMKQPLWMDVRSSRCFQESSSRFQSRLLLQSGFSLLCSGGMN